MPSHEDYIVKGQKFMSNNASFLIDIDEKKSAENALRVIQYADRKEKEIEEENKPYIFAAQ